MSRGTLAQAQAVGLEAIVDADNLQHARDRLLTLEALGETKLGARAQYDVVFYWVAAIRKAMSKGRRQAHNHSFFFSVPHEIEYQLALEGKLGPPFKVECKFDQWNCGYTQVSW